MSWFTRLFRRSSLVGQRVHAWHYTPWGKGRIEGDVIAESDRSLTIDVSEPLIQEFRSFIHVWRDDARSLNEPLPGDESGWTRESL